MARFRYLGEPARSFITAYGPLLGLNVPLKNGTVQELTPISPATEFPIGDDIGYEITDQRALRVMRADTRFEEI